MDDNQRRNDDYDPAAILRGRQQAKPVESAALLPGLNDAYKASGFVDNEVSRLVVILGKDGFKIGATAYYVFQYVHLGLGQMGFTANGQVFSFLFSDLQPKLLTVEGRSLQRIFDYIGLRRMPWIRVADRDYRARSGGTDNEPIITSITISDWLRSEQPSVMVSQTMA